MAHILNFYGENYDDRNTLMMYVSGHLYVEFALNELINKALKDPMAVSNYTKLFANKLNLLKSIGRLNQYTYEFLKVLNKTRNKIAHDLGYNLTYEECIDLSKKAQKAGIIFCDKNMYKALDGHRGHYEIENILEELIGGTFEFLFESNDDIFPNKEYKKYMSY